MAFVTYSGGTSGHVTVDVYNNTNSVIGHFTINDTHTLTFDIGAATKTSEISPFNFEGNYFILFLGGLDCNGTEQVRITWQSNSAFPTQTSYSQVQFRDVDAGSTLSYTDIKHMTYFYFQSLYNGNLTIDNVRLTDLQQGILYESASNQTFTSCEIDHMGTAILVGAGVGDVTLDHCWVHDAAVLFDCFSTSGSIAMTDCFLSDLSGGTGRIFDFNNKTITLTLTNVVMSRLDGNLFVFGTNVTAITSNLMIMEYRGDIVMNGCLNANFVLSNGEMQLIETNAIVGQNGGNLNDFLIICGKSAANTNYGHDVLLNVPGGGTPSGVVEVTALPYVSCDSVVDVRTTHVNPRTITGVTNTAPNNSSASITFTANTMGKTKIVYGIISVPSLENNVEIDLEAYANATPWFNTSFVSTIDSERQGFLGARTRNLPNLKDDETYFYRIAQKTPWGEIIVSDENSFTTTAISRFPGAGTLDVESTDFDLALT